MNENEPTAKDLKFMAWVIEGAQLFSTCAKAQYMALLTDKHGYVLGTGYNGSPKGMVHCVDGGCPRYINGTQAGSSYDDCIAIHAEANALLHSDYSVRREGTLYVNGVPCFSCAKLIANSGLRRVVYLEQQTNVRLDAEKALKFLEQCGFDLIAVEPESRP